MTSPWVLTAFIVLAFVVFWGLRRRVPTIWLLVGSGVLGILVAFLARREPLMDLTPTVLAEAKSLWEGQAPAHYEMDLLVHADRLDDGRIAVQVRDGHVVSVTRNELPSTAGEEGYSVQALFDMLERELVLSKDPEAGFGAPSGYRAYLRVRFHPELGYPQKYRRTVGGTTNGVEIQVTRFQEIE